jgi:trafficking protein particle complex subunit 2
VLQREEVARAAHFILHAALDMVDVNTWAAPATYLKVVDRQHDQLVSAHVTQGGARLLLLHESRNEDGIRAFFADVGELYAKACLNPFYAPGSRVESRDFDARVRAAARRHLGWRGGD